VVTPARFVDELRALRLSSTFNPYLDRCEVHDVDDAPSRRSRTLLAILQAATEGDIDSVWIGRDLGYRGGRRTGLALTDDVHVGAHVGRWGATAERPTRDGLVAERTAAVVWSMLGQIDSRIFLWNVFPFHPHQVDRPFSNRSHTASERTIGEGVLAELIDLLQPRRLVAIGNDAARTAERLAGQRAVVQVRHPSYGGQTEFKEQIGGLYGVPAGLQRSLFDD
jgi:uracil-DNA glycosylase